MDNELAKWGNMKYSFIKGILTISDLYSFLIDAFKNAGEKSIGYKKQMRSKNKKLPKEIRLEIKKRNKHEKEWKRARKDNLNDNEIDVLVLFNTYIKSRQNVGKMKSILRGIHNKNLSLKIREAGGISSSLFWRSINNKKADSNFEALLNKNGNTVTEIKDIADVLEKYMISLKNNGSTNINIKEYGVNREAILGERSIITQDISDKDIDRAIKKCKNGKSTGFDKIPNEFIINMSVNPKEVLKQLFNMTLCNGNIPQQWKEDKLLYIYKGKGDKRKLDNYRGISIGSNVGKCFFRIINNRMEEFIEKEGILGEIQNAFRKGRRSTDSIYNLYQIIELAKQEKRKEEESFC